MRVLIYAGKNRAKLGKTSGLCAPTKSQDNTNQQTPLGHFLSKTEEQINKKQENIKRLQNKVNEILAKLERVKSDSRDGNICRTVIYVWDIASEHVSSGVAHQFSSEENKSITVVR